MQPRVQSLLSNGLKYHRAISFENVCVDRHQMLPQLFGHLFRLELVKEDEGSHPIDHLGIILHQKFVWHVADQLISVETFN